MKAFPTHSINVNDEARVTAIGGEGGMDLRDYFAAKALPRVMQDGKSFTESAMDAYLMANVMMEAREQSWPFPPFPNPKHKDQRKPKFNPENEEDAPV